MHSGWGSPGPGLSAQVSLERSVCSSTDCSSPSVSGFLAPHQLYCPRINRNLVGPVASPATELQWGGKESTHCCPDTLQPVTTVLLPVYPLLFSSTPSNQVSLGVIPHLHHQLVPWVWSWIWGRSLPQRRLCHLTVLGHQKGVKPATVGVSFSLRLLILPLPPGTFCR